MRFWLHTVAFLLVTFAILELAARLVLGVPVRLRFDRRYDEIAEPDRLTVQSTEGFSRDRTNELGHYDTAMPAGPPRIGILVVGDSYTEGRQVAMADRLTNRVAAGLGIRVYNAGHAGWSPINALAFLRAELASFRPSTVIVQVSGNDLKDVVSARAPHLVERDDAWQVAHADYARARRRWLLASLISNLGMLAVIK